MTQFSLEAGGAAIVFRGQFNPSIFHPSWFGSNGLISKDEVVLALQNNLVVTQDFSMFKTDSVELSVSQDRFALGTNDPTFFRPLRDLAKSILILLSHTPIHQLGINRNMHYKMPSDEERDKFGDFLVPKSAWNRVVKKPGLRTLIVAGTGLSNENSQIQTKIEPSSRVTSGVSFDVNHHYERPRDKQGIASELLEVLENSWETSLADSLKIAEGLFAAFRESEQ